MTVRVFIVDDSAVSRTCLRDVLELDRRIEVVGETEDPERALDAIAVVRPDLVTMDLHMAPINGLEAIERIMATHPVPILVVTERPTSASGDIVFEATRRGALELAAKPGDPRSPSALALRRQVERLASVPVVHHARRAVSRVAPARETLVPLHRPKVIAIGASAGGPGALIELLMPLSNTGACFAIVQHLPDGFANTFASFLGARTGLAVTVMRSAVPLSENQIFLAAEGGHLIASGGQLAIDPAPPVGGFRPSIDVLFHSIAREYGPRAAGVLLSGIGRDGAQGLLAMRKAGARTFAQDEGSCAVYGMPRAAAELGAADEVLNPRSIAARVAALHGKERP